MAKNKNDRAVKWVPLADGSEKLTFGKYAALVFADHWTVYHNSVAISNGSVGGNVQANKGWALRMIARDLLRNIDRKSKHLGQVLDALTLGDG